MAQRSAWAHNLAALYQVDLAKDFHAMSYAEVSRVIEAADSVKYRKPANANGSRARYFHARLVRAAARKD